MRREGRGRAEMALLGVLVALFPTAVFADAPPTTVPPPISISGTQASTGINVCGSRCVQLVNVVNVAAAQAGTVSATIEPGSIVAVSGLGILPDPATPSDAAGTASATPDEPPAEVRRSRAEVRTELAGELTKQGVQSLPDATTGAPRGMGMGGTAPLRLDVAPTAPDPLNWFATAILVALAAMWLSLALVHKPRIEAGLLVLTDHVPAPNKVVIGRRRATSRQ